MPSKLFCRSNNESEPIVTLNCYFKLGWYITVKRNTALDLKSMPFNARLPIKFIQLFSLWMTLGCSGIEKSQDKKLCLISSRPSSVELKWLKNTHVVIASNLECFFKIIYKRTSVMSSALVSKPSDHCNCMRLSMLCIALCVLLALFGNESLFWYLWFAPKVQPHNCNVVLYCLYVFHMFHKDQVPSGHQMETLRHIVRHSLTVIHIHT